MIDQPTSRRRFLGFLAAAPVGAKALAAEVLGKKAAADAATLLSAGVAGNAAPPLPNGQWLFTRPQMVTLAKLNMLPEWARREVEDQIRYNMRAGLDADIAALRSVSPSAKISMHISRNYKRAIDAADEVGAFEMARRAFFGQPGDPNQ